MFLDGGLEVVRSFVDGYILDAPFVGDEDAGTDIQPAIANFKSVLQELAQSRKLPKEEVRKVARGLHPAALAEGETRLENSARERLLDLLKRQRLQMHIHARDMAIGFDFKEVAYSRQGQPVV